LANVEFVGDISRRDFARFAASEDMLGVSGTLSACGAPTHSPAPARSEPTKSATPTPDNRSRPIKLTQADAI
jgi:hypothetical protein